MLELLQYFEKNCEVIYFRSLTLLFENMPKIISIGSLITEKRPFKRLKILSVLARFISKIKKILQFQFSINQIFRQMLFVSKNWKCKGQLLWKLRAVKLAILFY